jgi:hypothetical protein
VGIALARRFAVNANELVLLNLGDNLAAFTWLGRLHNVAFEGLFLRNGVSAKAASFCIHLRGLEPPECLKVFRRLGAEPVLDNPFLDSHLEKIIDLGPYFPLLNGEQQRRGRGDWFHPEVLRAFSQKLECLRVVQRNCPLGTQLASLASV